jgi:hypothetical protein
MVWVVSVIALLFMSMSATTYAETGTNNIVIQSPVSLGKVTLKENVTADINNLMLMPSTNGQIVSFIVTVKNNSNTELNFIDYWVNVSTSGGAKITVQTANTEMKTIPAKSTKDILFYGTTANGIKITDLIIKLIKWDFTVPSYMNVLGQIKVPQRYNPSTQANSGRLMNTEGVDTSFVITQATIGKSSKYYKPEIKLSISNQDSNTVTLPDYQFYISTNNNLLYPITGNNIKGTTLDPLVEKEFQLTASIPIEVKEGNWKLVVMYPVNDGKVKVPVAVFDLPAASSSVADNLGKLYAFTTSQGIYYAKINSLNRLPLEDDDLIIANLTLVNQGTDTIPMLDLTGKYTFNGKIEKQAVVSSNNRVIALQPGESVDLQLVGKVPYTFDISDISLMLQEKESGTDATDLVEFKPGAQFTPLQIVNWNEGFKIADVGYRANVKIRQFKTYKGQYGNIIAAQVLVTNEEKRAASMQQLAGYFQKKDGTVYPATFQTISEKLNPGGTAMIFATANVPLNTDLSDVQLVIGKAIVESQASTAGNQNQSVITGYVSPYNVNLPGEVEEQNSLRDIDIMPFKLSIDRIATQAQFEQNTLKLNFDYTLEQDVLTKADVKDHKYIIEISDANPKYTFSKSFAINTSTDSDATTGNDLRVGSHTVEISWSDLDFIMNMSVLKDFTLNVYDEIQPGYKKLIASQKLPWFVNRSLN